LSAISTTSPSTLGEPETPIARRLYRFLDKKLRRRAVFEIDIFQLGQQLGMAHYAFPAKVKEKLQPGLDELIARRFLASAELVRVQGHTRLRFVRGKGPLPSPPRDVAPPAARAPQPEEGCGDYGCTAEAWRRDAAREHAVAAETVQLWEGVLAQVRQKTSIISFQAWLARTLLLDLSGGSATILVPNAFFRNGIIGRYEQLFQEALREKLHSNVTLVYRLAAE
jgi:hypothetical protein